MSNDYSKYYKKTKATTTKDNKQTNIKATNDNRDIAEAQGVDKTIFGILLAILALLPLLTRTKVIDFTSPLITNSSIGSGTVGDVFTYYKFIFLVIATSLLLILFLYRTFGIGVPIKRSFINIPLAILALFVTLSALFAPYKSLALVGMYNRHEGAISYLCYFTLFFIAANLTYTKKMLHGVIYALYPVTIVNALLGLLAFYGANLIKSSFVKAILLPKGITEDMIGAGSQFVTTINHQNYVSGISVVLIVIFMMMFILDKNKIRQAVNGILAVLSFAMLLSSLSKSGFLTLVIILPVLVILLVRSNEKAKSYGKLAVQLVIFALIFVAMASHNPKVWDESMGMFVAQNPFAKGEQAISTTSSVVQNVNPTDLNNHSSIIINKEVADQYKNFAKEQLNKVSFVTPAYAESSGSSVGGFQLPQLPESGIGAGSGRLFIWGDAFDLIKQRPLTGYGLDTFAYHFPQNDPEKIAALETHTVIVDKPHNMYINMVYGAGIIALVALLVLMLIYFIKCVKVIYSQKADNEQAIVVLSLFIGWLAYLVQALFNDSVIGTAPVFWVTFGVLIFVVNVPKRVNKTK